MSGNTNNTVFIQRLFSSRDNFTEGNVQEATANALAFVGQQGRVWWEPVTNSFYYSDGNTPGGIPIGSGGGAGLPLSNGSSNFNIPTASGNVTITSNTINTWTFDETGNLILPANTFSVNYANGTQVSLGGGGLPLANGNSNFDIATSNGNVTITSNGSETWTFDDTGNLTVPGMILTSSDTLLDLVTGGPNIAFLTTTADGTTALYMTANTAQLYANSNVKISANTGGFIREWEFDSTGNLIVPGQINGLTNNNVILNAFDNGDNPDLQLINWDVANSAPTTLLSVQWNQVQINTDFNNATKTWTFDVNGNLTLPANTFSVNYANGTQVSLDGTYGNSNVISLLGNLENNPISNVSGITFFGDDSKSINYIPVTPGFGSFTLAYGEQSEINMSNLGISLTANANVWNFDTTGNLVLPANTFSVNYANGTQVSLGGGLPLANGNSNFDIATSNGNVTITSNGTSNWTFGTNGSTAFPGNTIKSPSDANVTIQNPSSIPEGYTGIVSTTGDWSIVPLTNLPTTDGTGTGLVVNAVESNGTLAGVNIVTPGSGYTNGDIITVTSAGASGTFSIFVPTYNWVFDNTGNLTIPQALNLNNGTISTPGNDGGINLTPSGGIPDQRIEIYNSGGEGSPLKTHLNTSNLYNAELVLGSDDYYVRLANTGNISIHPNDNNGNSATWTFDGTGNLTLPTSGNVNFSGTSNVNGNVSFTGANVSLGDVANVHITGGSTKNLLTTDGAGNLSWTAPGNIATTYGQFWSNASQTVATANTEYRFLFNNSDPTSNVALGTGASNSRIIINQTGLYNIQFSAQVDKTGSGTSSAYIWFKKNGTAVTDSSGFITLDTAIQTVESWNILANVTTAGDYYEIAYAASSTNFSFPTLAGNNIVGYPASPSIIVTVTPL